MSMPFTNPVDALPRLRGTLAAPPRGATLVGVVVAIAAAAILVTLSSVAADASVLPWALLIVALGLAGLYVRVAHPPWRAVLLLSGIGVCGAQFEHLLPSGPGFVIVFLTMLAMGYQLPLPLALVGALPAVAIGAEAAADHSHHPTEAITSAVVGSVLLVVVASRSAAHRRSREETERRRAEHDQAAAEAERARLARELHDILTHTLSGVQLRLEGTRVMLAQESGAPTPQGGAVVAAQVDLAHQLTVDGLMAARRAITSLRGDPMACPQMLPALLEEVRQSGLLPDVSLEVRGTPRALSPELGLAVYRTVQEALTNVARHAGPHAAARVTLTYLYHGVTVEVVNSGGAPVTAPQDRSSRPERAGYGLQGLAERAALLGGCLEAQLVPDGYRVRLSLPTIPGTV
jgi:signal transduction histidine kinase